MDDQEEVEKTKMVLTFEGLEGHDGDKILAKPISVLAWSWGAKFGHVDEVKSAPPNSTLSHLNLTSYLSEATPLFADALAKNRFFKTVRLEVTNKNQKLILILDGAFVSTFNVGGSYGESNLTVNYMFGFKKVEFILDDKTVQNSKPISSNQIENSQIYSQKRF